MGNENETMGRGYRILSVLPESPMSNLGVEPMLDFIILTGEEEIAIGFNSFVARLENKEVELTFYNIASRLKWKAKVTPRKWKGMGLLGVDLREEDFTTAHSRVLRVLNFFVNSPLQKAGFKSFSDFILGTEHYVFQDIQDFENFIRKHDNDLVKLYVYNSEDCNIRIVELTPNKRWGGSGYLGGDIGSGHLHSLPMRVNNQKRLPENTQSQGKVENLPASIKEEPKIPEKQEEKKNEMLQPKTKTETTKINEEVKKPEPKEKAMEVLGVEEADILIGAKKNEEVKVEKPIAIKPNIVGDVII